MLLSVKAGRFWDNLQETGLPDVTAVTYATSALSLPFEIPQALRGGVGFNNTPAISKSSFDIAARTYLQGDFAKVFRALGQDDFKAGIGTQKIVNRVLTDYPTGGYITVNLNRAYTSSVPGVPPSQRGTYGYYIDNEFGIGGTTGAALGNFYFQDNWRIIPRLTLNLGLRFESETVPSFQRSVKDYAFKFGWADKIAPRLGASFDVFGDGRAKVYASWGRYYDWVKYDLARGTFGGDYYRRRYYSLDTPDVFSLSSRNLPGRPLWNPAQPNAFRDSRLPGFDDIDWKSKPMASQNINAGVELRVGSNAVLRASWVHNKLIRTIEDLGALVDGNEKYYYANPGEGNALKTPTSGPTKSFPTHKALRTYDAAEFQLTKRSGKWFGVASYVYSRLYGNYAGLANSDEIRTGADGGGTYGVAQEASAQNFRPGGNANQSCDVDELLWDSKGNLDPRGRLATDRPHAMKLFGSRTLNWGSKQSTDLGAFFYAASVTPISSFVNTLNGTTPFIYGRGDLGRTPFLNYTNLIVGHELTIGEVKKIRLEFNAINLFNQRTARHKWTELNRQIASAEIDLSETDLAKGYDVNALLAATDDGIAGRALTPLFGQTDLFNPGFSGRLMLKFTF